MSRILNSLGSLTVGEIVKTIGPVAAVAGGLWWFFEPAVAGQIERVIEKYGVTKQSFQNIERQVRGIEQASQATNAELGQVKREQERIVNQNTQILFSLQRLQQAIEQSGGQ